MVIRYTNTLFFPSTKSHRPLAGPTHRPMGSVAPGLRLRRTTTISRLRRDNKEKNTMVSVENGIC